jgi:hypothetical protein
MTLTHGAEQEKVAGRSLKVLFLTQRLPSQG